MQINGMVPIQTCYIDIFQYRHAFIWVKIFRVFLNYWYFDWYFDSKSFWNDVPPVALVFQQLLLRWLSRLKKYTSPPTNPNPSSAYKKFWKFQPLVYSDPLSIRHLRVVTILFWVNIHNESYFVFSCINIESPGKK